MSADFLRKVRATSAKQRKNSYMRYLKFLSVILLVVLSEAESTNRPEQNCQIVPVSGFYVREYKKKEVLDLRENERLKEEGKSYQIGIDSYFLDSFIPFDSLGSDFLSSLLINDESYEDVQQFLLPSNKTDRYLQEYCGNTKVSTKSIIYPFADKPYYELENRDDLLYRILYLEGKAICTKIENSRYNRVSLNNIYSAQAGLDSINYFFIYELDIKPIDSLGLRLYRFEN